MAEIIKSCETLTAPYETFLERAAHETDQSFAEDLYLGAEIAAELEVSGGLALAVGGYARDSVMARLHGEPLESKDIDMEVYGLEFEDLACILENYGRVDLVGASFGVAKVTNPASGNTLDFSIPRRDSKVDKGHKGFQVTGDPDMSVDEAARRRDLTINALALNPLTGELIDHYGGIEDAKAGILRATDPELFKDDPLRVLRVMQFAGRFGFEVDPDTAEICRSMARSFDFKELPGSRVGEEWVKLMVKSERPSVGLEVARDLKVIDGLHPPLAAIYTISGDTFGASWERMVQSVDAAAEIIRQNNLSLDEKTIIMFASLCMDMHQAFGKNPDAANDFLTSLEISKKSIAKIISLIDASPPSTDGKAGISDKDVYLFAQDLKPANIRLWHLVRQADSANNTLESQNLYDQAAHLEVTEEPAKPIIQGRHLIAYMGLSPGKRFKDILDFMYDAQISGHFSTLDEGVAFYRSTLPHQIPLFES